MSVHTIPARAIALRQSKAWKADLLSFHTACVGIQRSAIAIPLSYALKQAGCHASAHCVCAVHKEDLDRKQDHRPHSVEAKDCLLGSNQSRG